MLFRREIEKGKGREGKERDRKTEEKTDAERHAQIAERKGVRG